MAGKAEGSGYTIDDIIEAYKILDTPKGIKESRSDYADRFTKAQDIIRKASRAEAIAAQEEMKRRAENAKAAAKSGIANTPRIQPPRSLAEALVPREQVAPPAVEQEEVAPPAVEQDEAAQQAAQQSALAEIEKQAARDKPKDTSTKKTFVENSTKGVAGAKPGDWIKRVNGTEYQLNKGDIEWAKKQLPPEEVKAKVETPAQETPAEEAATDTPFTPTPYSHLYDEHPATLDVTKLSGLGDGKSIARGYWGRDGEDVLQKDIHDKGGIYVPPTDDAGITIKNGRVYNYGTEVLGDEGQELYDKYMANVTGRPEYQGYFDREGNPLNASTTPRITLSPGTYVENGKAYRADGTEVEGKEGELIAKLMGGITTPVSPASGRSIASGMLNTPPEGIGSELLSAHPKAQVDMLDYRFPSPRHMVLTAEEAIALMSKPSSKDKYEVISVHNDRRLPRDR